MSYLVEFDVADDVERPGCPVCRATRRAGEDYMRTLMRNDITDPHVRQQIERAGGFCRHHVLVALAVAQQDHDTMGFALLGELLLGVTQRRLNRILKMTQRPKTRLRRSRSSSLVASGCPACDAEARRATAYIDIIAKATPSTRIGAAVRSPRSSLCIPHLDLALSTVTDRRVAASLAASTRQQGLASAGVVQLVLRQQAAGVSHKPPADEGGASAAVASWLIGGVSDCSPGDPGPP